MAMDGNDTRTGIHHEVDGVRREVRVDVLDPMVAAIYRTWTPAQRLQAGHEQAIAIRRLLASQLKGLNPGWTDDDVQREVARRFLGYHA